MTQNTRLDLAREKAQSKRALLARERERLWRDLPGGYRTGPDMLPGLGWVLEFPPTERAKKGTRDRRDYKTEREALVAYENHRATGSTGWGTREGPDGLRRRLG